MSINRNSLINALMFKKFSIGIIDKIPSLDHLEMQIYSYPDIMEMAFVRKRSDLITTQNFDCFIGLPGNWGALSFCFKCFGPASF